MTNSEETILQHLRQIVGRDYIITDRKVLERYGNDQSFVKPLSPLYVVKPGSKEEVRSIVLMANELGVPLVPYSSGTSLQGAHIPAKKSLTIDLARLNKIHVIDPVSRNVILEPGVTFKRLQAEVKPHGLRVLTPVGIAAEASVLGTYLEHTPLYSWPKYSPWEILTAEMVLPTGELMGTGQMDVAGSRFPYSWATPYASVNRMYFGAQGIFGIITKAAITVKTLYEAAKVFFVTFESLGKMLEAVRKLMHVEVTEEIFAVNPQYLALLLAKTWPGEFEDLKKRSAPWTLVMVVRGYQEEVELKTLDLKDVAAALQLKLQTDLPAIANAGERVLSEIACPQGVLNQNRYKGAWNPIFCHATMDKLALLHGVVTGIAGRYNYPAVDLGFFLLPLNHGGSFYFEPSFYRNPQDLREKQRVARLFLETSAALISQGAFFDRPYPLWAKMVYDKAPAYHRKIREVKAILDPKNIMNPGKLALS